MSGMRGMIDPNKKLIHFKDLIEKGANVNVLFRGASALIYACALRVEQCVPLLIEAGVSIDIRDKHGLTALMWACENKLELTVPLLIKASSSIDIKDNDGNTAFMYACRYRMESAIPFF